MPDYRALIAASVLGVGATWITHVVISYFLYDGAAFVWSLIPVFGPLLQALELRSFEVLGAVIPQALAAGLGIFAHRTKVNCADFLRGPAAVGAKAVAIGGAIFGFVSLIGGFYFLLYVEPSGQYAGFMDSATYFWLAVLGFGVAAIHLALSWIVKHSVDGRDELTLFGLVHPALDAAKMIWKEDFAPPNADKVLYTLAPIIAIIPAFATFAVIPFGPDLQWGPDGDALAWIFSVHHGGATTGTAIPLQVANINVGILYIFAIAGTGIIGAALAGYSSDNKYSLLGGLRAASQMVSYEVTLGLTIVGCFMVYGTLLLDEMVAWQHEHVWGFIVQPFGLILFFFASIAEMKRVPFDAPEGESEIVAGYFLEYAGMKWGMFMTGEFVEHVVSSGIIVTLFFGGYHVPFLEPSGFVFESLGVAIPMWHGAVVALSVVAFLFKMLLVMVLQLQVRWTLPRFRYDQIMQLCWKIILPASLANILVTGIVILLLQ